ncbi:MAG: PucR family transcriptional regulator ligand-binding domain-containing protein [Bacillota bacterium]|nr:PucR family transcriptional regulator ligand-binding domain-containing protein [Bacillota bacterium]
MKVTVADCLELDAFKGARVVAGKMNMSNDVKSISVMDAGSVEELALAPGCRTEILLTGFLGFRDDVELQCRMVHEIAVKGCAALAVYYCKDGRLPDKLIEQADKEMLPLIVMSGESRYSETINDVMDKVLYGDKFSNTLISNTIFNLLNFEKHSNFQSAVREAAINNDFQLIILSEEFNPILTIETQHRATIADAIKLGKERNVENTGTAYTMIDVNGVLTYWGPVKINNEKYYMFIVDNEDSYTAGEITMLAEIIELAMGMWKYTPERDVKAEFIKALMRGNKSLAYTLKDEARISGDDILSVFFCKGVGTEKENQAFLDFEKEEDLNVMRITEGDETYGMILTYEEDGTLVDKNRCFSLFKRLKGDKTSHIYHITGLNGIEGAGDAYRLISESWSFVQSVFPYKRVFTKYELTLVSNCINIQIQGGFVKKNYTELLEPFKGAGENKGRQLLDTLETFVLDAGMNSGKTADLMGIHTNTVQYRLKKINELLGVEITGNRVIPGLTMALALKRLEKVVS